MPRSRFNHAMKALRIVIGALILEVVGGRKAVWFACKILAKSMSPFKDQTDTVTFSSVIRATRAMPANMKIPIDIK